MAPLFRLRKCRTLLLGGPVSFACMDTPIFSNNVTLLVTVRATCLRPAGLCWPVCAGPVVLDDPTTGAVKREGRHKRQQRT